MTTNVPKCEDPKLMKAWFIHVQGTIQKYGTAEKDIYNTNETGFQKGVVSQLQRLSSGSETRDGYAKSF